MRHSNKVIPFLIAFLFLFVGDSKIVFKPPKKQDREQIQEPFKNHIRKLVPERELTSQEIIQKSLPSVVLLMMEDRNGQPLSLGSGFFV